MTAVSSLVSTTMKTVVIFGIALLCFIFSVVSKNMEDPHVDVQNKISFDVKKFAESNPLIIPSAGTSTSSMMETKCECAVFDTQFPAEDSTPILTHSPFTVGCNCDASGEKNCLKLCSTLAEAARHHGPQLLCSALGHYNDLMASVHSRICGAKQWTYTGITAPHKICCHEHGVIPCKNQVENQALNKI